MGKEDYLLQLLADSVCLKQDQLSGYLNHTLIPEEQRVVEVHLACCPLCREALEGAEKNAGYKDWVAALKLPDLPVRKNEFKKHTDEEPANGSSGTNSTKKSITLPVIPKGSFNAHTGYTASHPKNLSWLGALGILLLLSIGGFLLWQYKSTLHWSSLFYNSIKSESRSLFSDSLFKQSDSVTVKKEPAVLPAKKAVPATISSSIAVDSAALKDSTAATPVTNEEVTNAVPPVNPAKGKEANPPKTLADTRRQPTEHKLKKEEPSSNKIATSKTNPPKAAPQAVKQLSPANPPDRDTKAIVSSNHTTTPPTPPPAQASFNNSDYGTGFQLYQQKQYASALLYLRTAAEDPQNPNHWQAVYYSGICNLEMGKKARARRLLKKVDNANIPGLAKKAREKLNSL